MKKIILAIVLGLVAMINGFAQEDFRKANVVKFSPQHLFISEFLIGLEHFTPDFNKSITYSLGMISGEKEYGYYYYDVDGSSSFNPLSFMGVSAEVEYKVYSPAFERFSRTRKSGEITENIRGLYVSGSFKTQYLELFQQDFTAYGDAYQYLFSAFPAAKIGFQTTWWKVFYIDVYVGGGVRFLNSTGIQSLQSRLPGESFYTAKGVKPKMGLSLGIAL